MRAFTDGLRCFVSLLKSLMRDRYRWRDKEREREIRMKGHFFLSKNVPHICSESIKIQAGGGGSSFMVGFSHHVNRRQDESHIQNSQSGPVTNYER